MPIPPVVQDLVRRFEAEKAAFKGGGYNETMLRREFLDPFFAALGWDVANRAGLGEGLKEVVHEARVRVLDGEREAALKSPDYAFRVGGVRRFFVEAKKPAVNVEGDVTAAFQTRRYAWSDPDVGVAILTDFEEFAVYDGRVKPSRGDSPEKARLRYFRYDAYEAEWDWIAGHFSREAVAGGALERLLAETGRKDRRGTETPGDAFLREIEGWREALAQELARKHPGLPARALNAAVQLTIDRIIFLRIAEDREIEPYGELREAARGRRVYPRLVELFRAADRRYNAGLFHFEAEAGRTGTPDALTPGLEIGDRVIKPIIEGLYYPNSPYAFKVLPVDLLGQVYERFLGKVIRLEKGRAVVEEKPEVKKAGGVFYTPTYVVDYIVRRTLGPLLEGKTVKQAAGLTVLDPACGSGSFLLGAYGYLLDWYLARYTEAGPEKHARGRRPRLVAGPGGEWRLSLDEKKRILREHLYGVDLDAQAVEVTKLSLVLRLLEGETAESLGRQLFGERVLPELEANVRRGNTLVEPDFYAGQDEGATSEEERYRVGAFDWAAAFPAVMARGGFDAVIGNPPYVRIQTMQQWAGPEVAYIKGRYRAAAKGNFDLYVVFVERGLGLLRDGGRLGFIVPHKFFNAQYGAGLRRLLAEGRHVAGVVHFGHAQVFAGATTYTALVFLAKDGAEVFGYAEVEDLAAWRRSLAPDETGARGEEAVAAAGLVEAEALTEAEWNVVVGHGADLFTRLAASHPPLGDVAEVYVGLQTSADAVYIMDLVARDEGRLRLYSKALGREVEVEEDLFFPLVSGTDVRRYAPLPDRQFILFPYDVEGDEVDLISMRRIGRDYPLTAAYLRENQRTLEGRENGRMEGEGWQGYVYRKNMAKQEQRKVCVPRLVDPLHATLDADGRHFLDNVDVNGVVWAAGYAEHDLRYLLGLLNSRLLRWYFPFVSAPFRGGFRSANKQFLSQLPLRLINFDDAGDVAAHGRMVVLVTKMLALHRQRARADAHTRGLVDKQIAETDAEIDALVYRLYDLTPEEIALVEGAGG